MSTIRLGPKSARTSLTALAFGLWLAPAIGAPDGRIRTIDYEPSGIVQLTGYVGYHIHFQFAPDERFVSLGAGDTAALDIGSETNHLFLKPRVATAGTNLTILTNRRTYFIEFRALARPPRPDEPVYSVAYRYESGVAQATAEQRPPVAGDATGPLTRPIINRAYWFCGSPALRPTYVADDGLQVRLKFSPQAELPAIYVESSAGEESLVNSHVEGDTVIIHRLARRFVLRRGREVACVVNRGSEIQEQRADGGTLDPNILRVTEGHLP